MERRRIPVYFHTEVTNVEDLKADEVIIATGAAPKRLPIPGAEHAMEATEYLMGRETGERVVVIGGGLSGCEIAYDLVLKGKKPVIVEMKEDLIPVRGVCLANSSFLRETFAYHETPVYLNTSVREIRPDGVTLQTKEGKRVYVDCDDVILSVGYDPKPLAGSSRHVHLVGDANGVGNLRTVIWRAWDVCMKI